MSLFDRFTAGIETLGMKANQAFDEGKLRMELVRVRRRMDRAARDLGYVTYRQSKGTPATPADVEAFTRRIADGESAAARIEAEIEQVKQRSRATPAAGTGPAAATGDTGATVGEAEPVASEPASAPPAGEAPPAA